MPRARQVVSDAALRPSELAEMLDRWALRREKVLRLLDPRAARAARLLARACQALGDDLGGRPEARRSWVMVRTQAERLLRDNRSGERPVTSEDESSK